MAKSLFNEQNISNVIYARELVESSKLTIEKTSKGMKISLLAMACLYGGVPIASILLTFIGKINIDIFASLIGIIPTILILAYAGLSIYAVIVGGGFVKVLKMGWKVAKWAWYLVPIFPMDLIIGFVAGYMIIIGFIFIPIVYLWLMKRQAVKDLKVAEDFIQAYETEASRFTANNESSQHTYQKVEEKNEWLLK